MKREQQLCSGVHPSAGEPRAPPRSVLESTLKRFVNPAQSIGARARATHDDERRDRRARDTTPRDETKTSIEGFPLDWPFKQTQKLLSF